MRKSTIHPKLLLGTVVLLFTFTGGGFSTTPAACQDPDDDVVDIEECESEKVTREDGKLCIHGLKCSDIEAKKLCFKFPG